MLNEKKAECGSTLLNKFLASAGVASRRKSASLIKDGLVTVNGQAVTDPAFRVSEGDQVCCRGALLALPDRKYYIMLNKPKGYICTAEDIHAPKKALDLIRIEGNPRLFSAGRLDKNSEGLILFSNDGDFVNRLTHPRNEIVKTYEVSVSAPLSRSDIARFLSGVEDAGEILRALEVSPVTPLKYRIRLNEGKNREIRRMIASAGKKTCRLKRISLGKLHLGSLPPGKWRFLSGKEVFAALQSGMPSLLPSEESPLSPNQEEKENITSCGKGEKRSRGPLGNR